MESIEKSISDKQMLMELNVIDQPYFLTGYKPKNLIPLRKNITQKEYEKYINNNNKDIFEKEMNEALSIKYIKEDEKYFIDTIGEEALFEYVDSNNNNVSFKIKAEGYIPREFELFVFVALMKVFLIRNGTVKYDPNSERFIFKKRKIYFSLYEIAKIMNPSRTGKDLKNGREFKNIRKAIINMANTKYISTGVFWDQNNQVYLNSSNQVRLIQEYGFSTMLDKDGIEKNDKKTTRNRRRNYVILNENIINNIEVQYFKYIDIDIFFNKLKSGMERKLYMYIERNKRDKGRMVQKYLERKYSTLSFKIPILYDKPSDFKRKTEKALDKLKEVGVIKDYIYGHITIINNKKEEKLILCIKDTAENIIKELEKSNIKELNNLRDIENIEEELFNIGISENKVPEIMKENDKWKLMKYILYFERIINQQKTTIINPPGLFINLLNNNMLESSSGNDDIIKFIDSKKQKIDKNEEAVEQKIEEEYKTFVKEKINNFIKISPFEYNMIKDNLLINIDKNLSSQLTNLKQLMKINKDNDCEQEKLQKRIKELDEFKRIREDSSYFKDSLDKELIVYLQNAQLDSIKIIDYEQFKKISD